MTFNYSGIGILYEKQGPAQPLGSIIFLHGWGCDHTVFSSFTEALSGKYDVYSIDFPGFGLSDEPDSVWGVEEYTRMLEEFVSIMGISSPSLIGHSFGGRVAILYASRNLTSKVVLTDSAGIKPRRSLGYYIKVYSYKCAKFVVRRILRSDKLYSRLVGGAGSADYRNASPRMKAILSKVVNEDLRDRLPLIKAPTLLFWGDMDTATPIADARLMEKMIPDAGLVTVQGGTHFSFLEAPALYSKVLANFFEI
ncbi:MAG: alpha/beta hydrolase [Bacteroidales bacterium]|nr:alpha/beta hydrolase [Bacteroidales bacterium]